MATRDSEVASGLASYPAIERKKRNRDSQEDRNRSLGSHLERRKMIDRIIDSTPDPLMAIICACLLLFTIKWEMLVIEYLMK